MDRIEQLIAKARMGDITPDERAELQEALKGAAPASRQFQSISSVLGSIPGTKGPGMQQSITSGLPPTDDGPFNFGMPTMDFLMNRSDPTAGRRGPITDEMGPSVAEQTAQALARRGMEPTPSPVPSSTPADTSNPLPLSPAGSSGFPGFEIDREAYPGGGGQIAAGWGAEGTDSEQPLDIMGEMPQGVFSQGGNPFAVGIYANNPDAYLLEYAKSKGAGPTAANMLVDPYKSAVGMSHAGMLGGGYGDSVFSGESMGDAQRMQLVEKFLDDYNQQGAFVNPDVIMEEMIRRAANTDYSNRTSPQTDMPYTREEIIELTNEQISAAAPFIGEGGDEYLRSVLHGASMEYINALAAGEFTEDEMSYPKYLQMMGLDELLS
jgi:hypothetical protein